MKPGVTWTLSSALLGGCNLGSERGVFPRSTEAFATGDPAFIADALGVLAKLKGMTALARETGLSRESLYRSLSRTGNPELATLLKVATALGLSLSAAPRAKPSDK